MSSSIESLSSSSGDIKSKFDEHLYIGFGDVDDAPSVLESLLSGADLTTLRVLQASGARRNVHTSG